MRFLDVFLSAHSRVEAELGKVKLKITGNLVKA